MSAKRIDMLKHAPARQHGAALLVMLVIMVVGIAAILVNSLTASSVKTARQATTAAALAQAKAALIGYAVTYADTHSTTVPGYLPCPDTNASNGEGSSILNCGSQDVSAIGRLPWATLDLAALRDGDGECLWYAVSGTYKSNSKTGLMNWDTNGQFLAYAADGTLLTTDSGNQVVAVIFAPGAPLSGQNRSPDGTAPICGGNYTASNYLDAGTVNSVNFNNTDIATGKFIQGISSASINDQMVFITRQDIWNAIQKRTDFQSTNVNINPLRQMTYQVALCLANYGNNNGPWWWHNYSLPWPAPLSLGTNLLTDYYSNTNYDDHSNLYAGRVPYNVNTSQATTSNAYSNLMTTSTCGSGWTSSVNVWWNNWKDQLFYALSQEFKPTNSTYQNCGFNNCLKINGYGQYAAVVMFAGPRLSALNQTRADKSVVTAYLEGNNAGSFPGANGNENYQTASASSTFNDVLCYIDENLNVNCP